jgi:K+-transporting ATPase ATPase C chain
VLQKALLLIMIFTVITGIIYPIIVTAIAQTIFPYQANGSLIFDSQSKQIIGSELLGQNFSQAKYFWARPSSTSTFPYNAAASSGSNLGPTNKALLEAVQTRITMLTTLDPQNNKLIPVDLVTASSSGLDPHISLAAAEYQINRVAKARNLNIEKIRILVVQNTIKQQFGFLGEPCVNVLKLNLALDNIEKRKNY